MNISAEIEYHQAHFGPISQEIRDYVTDVALLDSRYLFTKTVYKQQYAYCTHCKKWQKPEEILMHNSKTNCIKCKSRCTVKKGYTGRKKLYDSAYIVYYQKSVKDPTILTAIGIEVRRNYSVDYLKVETEYSPSSSYVFEMGNSSMLYASYWDKKKWFQSNKIKSEFGLYHTIPCSYVRNSIKEAVKGTPFQYSTWEQYEIDDMVKFFNLYSKYPCIEYLTKLEYKYFVTAKLLGYKTFGAINWNGKSVEKILKLKKQDLRILQKSELEIKPLTLRLFQMTRNDTNRLTLDDLHSFIELTNDCFETLKNLFKYAKSANVPKNLTDTIVYINRQYNRKDKQRNYANIAGVMITWRDHIKDCITLGLDIKHENVLFPRNLFAAHQRTSSFVDYKVNGPVNEQIVKRLEKLNKFVFENEDLVLFPASSCKELIDEGKALDICIGGYAKDYADGKTDLFFIRKLEEINVPFFAMEIKNKVIIQTQGKGHCQPTTEVVKFIQAFKAAKLDKKFKEDVRNNQIEPVERQEVAV